MNKIVFIIPIIFVFFILIVGCNISDFKYSYEINQQVEVVDYDDCTYKVVTSITISSIGYLYYDMPYANFVKCSFENLDEVKEAEMRKAEEILPKIKKCFLKTLH